MNGNKKRQVLVVELCVVGGYDYTGTNRPVSVRNNAGSQNSNIRYSARPTLIIK